MVEVEVEVGPGVLVEEVVEDFEGEGEVGLRGVGVGGEEGC